MRNFLKNLLLPLPKDEEPTDEQKQERLQIATCVLLLEVALSDDELSSIEKTTISAILQHKFNLSPEAVNELISLSSREREERVDLWEFTNAIAEAYSEDERKKMMEAVWEVVYADDKLDSYEDYFVHKLITLLRVDHRDFIEAKVKVLDRKRT